jgi:hypothetical protein
MAQQIAGLCFLQGTFDQLTFYKMDGNYYCRTKSSLTRKRVKTSAEFHRTMIHAGLMARASKIGSFIYKALPAGWRQFWMYRSFTGEAFSLLKHTAYTDEEVKMILWKCYVEYWEQWEAANADNPALSIIQQQPPKRVRKRRVYSQETVLRRMNRSGKQLFRKPEEEERMRVREQKKAGLAELLEKEKLLTEQQLLVAKNAQANPLPAKQITNESMTQIVQPNEYLRMELFKEETDSAVTEVQEMLNVGEVIAMR